MQILTYLVETNDFPLLKAFSFNTRDLPLKCPKDSLNRVWSISFATETCTSWSVYVQACIFLSPRDKLKAAVELC